MSLNDQEILSLSITRRIHFIKHLQPGLHTTPKFSRVKIYRDAKRKIEQQKKEFENMAAYEGDAKMEAYYLEPHIHSFLDTT